MKTWRDRVALADLGDGQVLGVLVGVAVLTSLISLVIHGDFSTEWWEGWFQNFSTEMFGAFLTFWLLEIVVEKRRDKEHEALETQQRKEQLIRQMRSDINLDANRAVEALGAHGWLKDGSLEGVKLRWAKLQDAKLAGAKLAGADMYHADLANARLWQADLRGVNMLDANLRGAKLDGAKFDTETILPDKTLWTPDVDWGRFIDPNHPQFWRPDWLG